MKPDHPVRRWAINLVHSRRFNIFILVVILANCVTLALNPSKHLASQRPTVCTEADYVKGSRGVQTLIADCVFLAIFTLEAILKVIAMGFSFAGPRSYLRDYWNVLDLLVVIGR